MTTIIVFIGIGVYLLLYSTYGKKFEKDVVRANDQNLAPSKRLFDGVVNVSARKEVLFGHHFASMAGAAPIIGPALAMCWGWLPGLLWVWFGNAFIGAVHDYLALMASVRYDGKSIQFVAADLMGKRTGRAFYWLVFFLLVLVVAAFAAIIGGIYTKTPAVASAYIFKIIAALILGFLLYRTELSFVLSTIIGIVMLCVAIALGPEFPIAAGYHVWMWVFFFYIIIASAIPVNVVLQPSDCLNSWLRYAGLFLGFIAAVFVFRGFEVPTVSSFSPVLLGGKPTPFWPAIPLVISSGSLSGFHSLVASGTSSKQMEKETDGLFIGYGAMLSEGFLSTIVIVSIAGFGYTALKTAGISAATLNADNWGAMFTKVSAQVKFSQANLFIQSYADMIHASWLKFIPTIYVKILAGMWVSSFAMTTLDTANRLARYCLTQMALPLKDTATRIYEALTNRWVASVIPAAIGLWLADTGDWLIIWGSFGAANQLIASIALMTGAAYVAKRLGSSFAYLALVPAWLLYVTVTAALLWFIVIVQPGEIAANPGPGWSVMVITIIMFLLNFIFIYDFFKSGSYRISRSNRPA